MAVPRVFGDVLTETVAGMVSNTRRPAVGKFSVQYALIPSPSSCGLLSGWMRVMEGYEDSRQ